MMSAFDKVMVVAVFTLVAGASALASDEKAPISDYQAAVLMFVDYGRSYGYQTMMARIQIDTVKADIERDEIVLKQKQELFKRRQIPEIEFEVARLKDAWNRKQLIVAEKSLAYVSAEYEAMSQMAKHYAGEQIPVQALYATFRRGWEAGCDKGPDEVAAMKAWADYLEKSLERARQLNRKDVVSFAAVNEKEAQLKTARSNYTNRLAGLEKCRAVLFPSLDDVLAIKR